MEESIKGVASKRRVLGDTGWIEVLTSTGLKYYVNRATRESSWLCPPEAAVWIARHEEQQHARADLILANRKISAVERFKLAVQKMQAIIKDNKIPLILTWDRALKLVSVDKRFGDFGADEDLQKVYENARKNLISKKEPDDQKRFMARLQILKDEKKIRYDHSVEDVVDLHFRNDPYVNTSQANQAITNLLNELKEKIAQELADVALDFRTLCVKFFPAYCRNVLKMEALKESLEDAEFVLEFLAPANLLRFREFLREAIPRQKGDGKGDGRGDGRGDNKGDGQGRQEMVVFTFFVTHCDDETIADVIADAWQVFVHRTLAGETAANETETAEQESETAEQKTETAEQATETARATANPDPEPEPKRRRVEDFEEGEESDRDMDRRHEDMARRHGDMARRHGDMDKRHGDMARRRDVEPRYRDRDGGDRYRERETRHGDRDTERPRGDVERRQGETGRRQEETRRRQDETRRRQEETWRRQRETGRGQGVDVVLQAEIAHKRDVASALFTELIKDPYSCLSDEEFGAKSVDPGRRGDMERRMFRDAVKLLQGHPKWEDLDLVSETRKRDDGDGRRRDGDGRRRDGDGGRHEGDSRRHGGDKGSEREYDDGSTSRREEWRLRSVSERGGFDGEMLRDVFREFLAYWEKQCEEKFTRTLIATEDLMPTVKYSQLARKESIAKQMLKIPRWFIEKWLETFRETKQADLLENLSVSLKSSGVVLQAFNQPTQDIVAVVESLCLQNPAYIKLQHVSEMRREVIRKTVDEILATKGATGKLRAKMMGDSQRYGELKNQIEEEMKAGRFDKGVFLGTENRLADEDENLNLLGFEDDV